VIEKNEEGYFAFCPELQGCYTQGDTYEEVLENIKDAIRLHVNAGSGCVMERLPRITAVEMQSFQWKSSKNY
jgi:predicted RNase H-like HicB family nuclease